MLSPRKEMMKMAADEPGALSGRGQRDQGAV